MIARGSFVVVDVETSGPLTDPGSRVCEVAAVAIARTRLGDVVELGAFESLVRLPAEGPREGLAINGLREEQLELAPAPHVVGLAFEGWWRLYGRPPIWSWRRAFDLTMVQRSFPGALVSEPRWWRCAWTYSRARLPESAGASSTHGNPAIAPPHLRATAAYLGIDVGAFPAHRAMPDARLLAAVLVELNRRAGE